MAVISRLIHYPAFLSEVVRGIRGQVLGALIHHNGTEGTVTDYRLTAPLEFQPADCVGTTCTIAFSGRGEATATGPGPRTNSPVTFLTERPLLGYVDVAWPEGLETGTAEAFEALYPSMVFDVRVESAAFQEI